jgi:large subunit ribosomal protein L4
MITLPIYSTQGKQVESVKLDEHVFDGKLNTKVLYQAIHSYRANQRKGLAATKTRGEVSGGGKKPWKQKGTGRARVGSIRSPLWRHGGVVFGPHPRDFSYSLPQKIRTAALKAAFVSKLNDENVIVLENFKIQDFKTKEAVKIFTNLGVSLKDKKVLLLMDKIEDKLHRILRNISFLEVNIVKCTNAYEVMIARKIIVSKDGLRELTARLK